MELVVVEAINPICFHDVNHLVIECMCWVLQAIVFCILVEHVSLIIVINVCYVSLWELKNFSYLGRDRVSESCALEESHSLCLVENCLDSVVVGIKFSF